MKDYSDIIDHPHHVSRTHPQMSMHDRVIVPPICSTDRI